MEKTTNNNDKYEKTVVNCARCGFSNVFLWMKPGAWVPKERIRKILKNWEDYKGNLEDLVFELEELAEG